MSASVLDRKSWPSKTHWNEWKNVNKFRLSRSVAIKSQ